MKSPATSKNERSPSDAAPPKPAVSSRPEAFASYIALDWSGAKTANGISIAIAHPGQTAPVLVAPTGARWTREGALEFLRAEIAHKRVLVGVDFALSLPVEPAAKWAASARALWALVDETCPAADDLYARAFAQVSPYAGHFWVQGQRPPGFKDRTRAGEIACTAQGHGTPQSPFKLIGAKQVGLGSLAGMRVLHRLSAFDDVALHVWPCDGAQLPSDKSVVVEIYPRLFIREAQFGNRKLRTVADVNETLRVFGSAPMPLHAATAVSDHDADALVSAAGLRAKAAIGAVWEAPSAEPTATFEGWIFGVPARQ